MLFQNKVSSEFTDRVQTMSDNLNGNPDWYMYVMWNETAGTFSPSIKNPQSTATGLIQFLEGTAKGLGTTTKDIAAMSAVQQLDYVEKYFLNVINQYGPLNSVSDVYLAVFYPAAINWTEDQKFSNSVYVVNKVFDFHHLGYITKAEFEEYVNTHFDKLGGSDSMPDATQEAGAIIPVIPAFVLSKNDKTVLIGGGVFLALALILVVIFSKLSK